MDDYAMTEGGVPGLLKKAEVAIGHLIEADRGLREILGPSVREEVLEAKDTVFLAEKLSLELREINELSATIAIQVKRLLDDFQRGV